MHFIKNHYFPLKEACKGISHLVPIFVEPCKATLQEDDFLSMH